MQIDIFAIGRMKKGPEAVLLDGYMDRAQKSGRGLGISSINIIATNESRKPQAEQRKAEEACLILEKCPNSSYLIALDENGSDLSSRQFASLIQNNLNSGISNMCFAIGGPDGHGEELLEKADKSVRFGQMTWPHQIVRILLAEQIYRSTTILNGHPYHRD